MDNTTLQKVTELTNEHVAIENEYAAKLTAFREKLINFFITTMENYGLDELMLLPLTPNGYQVGSWDCVEDTDADFDYEQEDLVECTVKMLSYGEKIDTEEGTKINLITRFGIRKGKLIFHSTKYAFMGDGDLSLDTFEQDNWQAPWHPISDYEDTYKLIEILLTYLSRSGNWEFTQNHPECRFLHRKLDSKDISLRIKEKSGSSSFHCLFARYYHLKTIDLSGLDASSATTVQGMFYNCNHLASINLVGLDLSNCKTFESMFDGCTRLKSLDVSCLNTASAITMKEMFKDCSSIEILDLSTFDTGNCTDVSMMFMNCKHLHDLNLSNWDLSNVGYTYVGMFLGCKKLSKIYLRNVNADTFETIQEAIEDAGLKNVEIIAEISE